MSKGKPIPAGQIPAKSSIPDPTGEEPEAGADVSIPVDRDGLVVYYTLHGRRYLLNGHTGSWEVLSEAAAEVYEALLLSDGEARWKGLRDRWETRVDNRIEEVRRWQAGTDPAMAPHPRQESFRSGMRPHEFTVYLAKACNLACQYCFNSGGTFGRGAALMEVETARETLDFISGIVRSGVHSVVRVNLFGGEPLLAGESTRVLARGLQDLNHMHLRTRVHILLYTNGTIYHSEIFAIMAERPDLCTVITSLDGDRDHHDRNRPFAGGHQGSSFDAAMECIRRMQAERTPYSVSCVVPWPFDFIGAAEALHGLGIRRLEVTQPLYHTYGHKAPAEVLRTEYHRWRENYLAYCEFYLEHLRRPDWALHTNWLALPQMYQGMFATKWRNGLSCGLADGLLSITPQGELMPCISFLRHEEYGLGHVRSGFDPLRYSRFEQWLLANGQHRFDHPRCSRCFAKLACGGGCYAERLDQTGTLQPRAEHCLYVRERVKIDLHFIAELRNRYPSLYQSLVSNA